MAATQNQIDNLVSRAQTIEIKTFGLGYTEAELTTFAQFDRVVDGSSRHTHIVKIESLFVGLSNNTFDSGHRTLCTTHRTQ